LAYLIVSGCVLVALFILRAAIGRLEPNSKLTVAHSQTIGRREVQADAFEWAVHDGRILLVIADGIGSGAKGRTAALAATDSIVHSFEMVGLLSNPAYFFRQAFHNANEAVLRHVPDGTSGANVLCALIQDGMLYYALAGNCRAAVFRGDSLISLSEGQTLDVLARNAFRRHTIRREDARLVYKEHRVYNYVGKDDFRELEMFDIPVTLKTGDYIVLMTDGVYDFCPQQDLESLFCRRSDCEQKAKEIMSLLEQKKDAQQDNATIAIARINRV
jgi:serine/threonine protein phosphatase PrpC